MRRKVSRKQWFFWIGSVAALSVFSLFLLTQRGIIPLHTLRGTGRIDQMRFSPDGRLLAVVEHGHDIALWDTQDWKQLRTLSGSFSNLYFSPDGLSLVTVRLQGGVGAEAVNHGDGLTIAQWDQFRNKIQTIMERWDLATSQVTITARLPLGSVEAVAAHAHWIALRRDVNPRGLSILDDRNWHEVHFLASDNIISADFSPDGRWLAVQTSSTGHAFSLWDTRIWHPVSQRFPDGIQAVHFSQDNQWLGLAASGSISLWRISDWRKMWQATSSYPETYRLLFTRDSTKLVADEIDSKPRPIRCRISAWYVSNGQQATTIDNQEPADWNMTTRGILTHDMGDSSANVLWNLSNGKRVWSGSPAYFPVAAVSPDGRTLITASLNGSHFETDNSTIQVRLLPRD